MGQELFLITMLRFTYSLWCRWDGHYYPNPQCYIVESELLISPYRITLGTINLMWEISMMVCFFLLHLWMIPWMWPQLLLKCSYFQVVVWLQTHCSATITCNFTWRWKFGGFPYNNNYYSNEHKDHGNIARVDILANVVGM